MFANLGIIWNDFAAAWQLLTVIPLPFAPKEFNRPAGKAATYYPLVGLVIGLILGGTGWLLYLLLPVSVAATLLLAIWVGLTGMLHLDGFMDACDGLLPPRDPARRLEIMKDSRVGAFGVVGAALLLLLKFSGLVALPTGSGGLPALIVIPALARFAVTWAMTRYPMARKEGLGVFFRQGLGRGQVMIAALIAGGVTLVGLQLTGLVLLLVAWLTTTLVARLALSRIGGLTGDVYGTICEMVEAALLIAVLV